MRNQDVLFFLASVKSMDLLVGHHEVNAIRHGALSRSDVWNPLMCTPSWGWSCCSSDWHASSLCFVVCKSDQQQSHPIEVVPKLATHHSRIHGCCSVLCVMSCFIFLCVMSCFIFFIRLLIFSSHLRLFFFQFEFGWGPPIGIQRWSKVGIHCKLELKEIELK